MARVSLRWHVAIVIIMPSYDSIVLIIDFILLYTRHCYKYLPFIKSSGSITLGVFITVNMIYTRGSD